MKHVHLLKISFINTYGSCYYRDYSVKINKLYYSSVDTFKKANYREHFKKDIYRKYMEIVGAIYKNQKNV